MSSLARLWPASPLTRSRCELLELLEARDKSYLASSSTGFSTSSSTGFSASSSMVFSASSSTLTSRPTLSSSPRRSSEYDPGETLRCDEAPAGGGVGTRKPTGAESISTENSISGSATADQ